MVLCSHRLLASSRCRDAHQQEAAHDGADHQGCSEATPRVVVFAVLNEERNHKHNPTDRLAGKVPLVTAGTAQKTPPVRATLTGCFATYSCLC